MKTFRQFQEESRISEGALGAALKLGGKVLAGYSAFSAANNLRKGRVKQAGMDAVGVVPGGKVFKGVKALGGAKNLAKAGSAAQSTVRLNLTGKTPNAFAKGVDTVFDKGVEYGGKLIKKIRGK